MQTTATIHEKITANIIKAIEEGQIPPWRKAWRPDLQNSGFPCDPHPFTGITTARLGLPVFADMEKLPNHNKHLDRWVRAMQDDPTLIFNVAADASQAVPYLFSLSG